MKLDSDKLDEIESVTVEHYDSSAESFWAGTKDHDVTQNYHSLAKASDDLVCIVIKPRLVLPASP